MFLPWEQQEQTQRSQTVTKTQKYAVSGRSEFFAFSDMPKMNWEVQPPHLRPSLKSQRGVGAGGRSQFAFPNTLLSPSLTALGFEQQIHIFYRLNRWSATKGKSDFAVFPSAPPNLGYDQTASVSLLKVQRGLVAGGLSQFSAFPDMPKVNWDVQPPQLALSSLKSRGMAAWGRSEFQPA